jgi:lipopolysaccharide export system permease protein
MSLKDLNRILTRKTAPARGFKQSLLRKISPFCISFIGLCFTVLGVALSSRKVRGGVGLPLGIGILLCFTYIIVDKFAIVFSIKGGVPPLNYGLYP